MCRTRSLSKNLFRQLRCAPNLITGISLVLFLAGPLVFSVSAQSLPNFSDVSGTQITNTNGQWVTVRPAQPNNIDLVESAIFKMPKKGSGILAVEFILVGADGGTARFQWGLNNKFGKGGGGGQVSFIADIHKTDMSGVPLFSDRPFLVTFGKKGESTTIHEGFYSTGGGGGSTGMMWLVPGSPAAKLNELWEYNEQWSVTYGGNLIAAAGGGGGGFAYVYGSLDGNSATGVASAVNHPNYAEDSHAEANYYNEKGEVIYQLISGGSSLWRGYTPSYCCTNDIKPLASMGLPFSEFDYKMGLFTNNLSSVTHGQKGGKSVTVAMEQAITPNISGLGMSFKFNNVISIYVRQPGGRGGAGLGGGGGGAPTSTASDNRPDAFNIVTGGAGGTGSINQSSFAKMYPGTSDGGWNDYSPALRNVVITPRAKTDNPQSGYMMYRTIMDTEPPVIETSNITVTLKNGNTPLGYNATVSVTDALQPYIMQPGGITDNDGIASVTAAVYSEPLNQFECFMAGSDVPVTLTVTDMAGNVTEKLVMVHVVDPFVPIPLISGSSHQQIDVTDGPVRLSGSDFPTGYDGCKGSTGIFIHFPSTTFYCNDVGSNTIEYYYTDSDGNRSKTYTKTFDIVCSTPPGENPDNNPPSENQRILYVDRGATGSNDGLSWANAFTDLQDALNYGQSVSAIYVASGTYSPTSTADDQAKFVLNENAKLYGGFPAGGSDFAARNPKTNPTILSGKISSTTNSTLIVFIAGRNIHLEGFTISDGKVNGAAYGGGMALKHIEYNPSLAGASFITTVRNCKFTGNHGNYGGAVYAEYAYFPINYSLNFENCEFVGNSSDNDGGAVYVNGGSPLVQTKFINCVFSQNNAGLQGGGLAIDNLTFSEIINCTFSGNTSQSRGAAILSRKSFANIHNSILYYNTSADNTNRQLWLEGEGDYGALTRLDYNNIEGSGGSGNFSTWQQLYGNGNITIIVDDGNNIDADPQFADNPALSIQATSPSKDAGLNSYNPEPYDLNGNKRIQMEVIDMGAYETESPMIFVAADAPAGGDGSSWATAYNNLNDGIAAAGTKDIWVKEGTYRPDRVPGSNTVTGNNRDNSFFINHSVKIYGGFAGTETSTSQRNIGQHPTILSGDIGTLNDASDNTYHVLTIMAGATHLDGLIIEGGNANDPQDFNKRVGGGVVQYQGSNNVITNCVFRNNHALYNGGAWYVDVNSETKIDFVQTLFYGNSASRAAAVFMQGSRFSDTYQLNFYNITAYGNTSTTVGAGAFEAAQTAPNFAVKLNFYNSLLAGNSPQNHNDATNPGNILLDHTYTAASGPEVFSNISNIAGADGKIMTADDGLQLSVFSPAISFGNIALVYNNALDKDIANNPRVFNSIDAGAYESSYISPLAPNHLGIIYVRPLALGDGTGSSWENATNDLHNAIHANGVQKVFIAKGTYKVGAHSFIMKNGVEIYGGFDPGSGITDLSHPRLMPNPVNNAEPGTVLDGEQTRPVIWNICTESNPMDNTAVLDGVIITAGRYSNGGGVRNVYASPTFRNVVISTNRATLAGAGIYNQNSSPVITNVLIINNGIDALVSPNGGQNVMGAGIYNTECSNPVLTNVTLAANYLRSTDAQMLGVGIRNNNSSPVIRNSIFYSNRKGYNITMAGTDIENAGTVNLTLKNSITQEYDTHNPDDHNLVSADPGFANPDIKNYRLALGSPAIDAGDNAGFSGLSADSKDLAGLPRVFDLAHQKTIDIGAYEYQCTPVDYSTLTLQSQAFTYNGNPHSLSVENIPQGVGVAYEITDSLNHTTTGHTATLAGVYTVKATTSPSVSGVDCEPVVRIATLTIHKAPAEITATPVQKYIYDGTVKNVVATLNHTDTTLAFSPQQGYTLPGTYPVIISAGETANYVAVSDTVSLVIREAGISGIALRDSAFTYDGTPKSLAVSGLPQGATVTYTGNGKINAGTYTVTAIVKRENYRDSTLTATLTIRKAAAVITAAPIQKHAYDSTTKNVQAFLNHAETVLTYSPQQGYLAVGTYPVIISATETANYRAAKDTVSLVIEKANLSGIALRDSVFTYDGTPKALAVTGLPEGATATYSGNGKINAGLYTVIATVKRQNYQDSTLTATLTIRKAPGVITAAPVQKFVYDGSIKNVTARLNHTETVLAYSPQRGYSDAGSYPILVSAAETANYLVAADTVQLLIEGAPITGLTFRDSAFVYEGTAHSLAVNGLPEGASVTYTGNARINAGTYSVTATVKRTNHRDSTLTASLRIDKAPAVITAGPIQKHVYDGSIINVVATLNHTETALAYSPQKGYSATGTYTIRVSAAETANYRATADTVSLIIAKAGLTGIIFRDSSFTYDGTAKALAVTGLPGDVTVVYDNNGKINAGTYRVNATVSHPHYRDSLFTATLTVKKAPAVITAAPVQKHSYDGSVKNVAAFLNHTEAALSYLPKQGYSALGAYSVIISATETANYLAAADTVELVIEKANSSGIVLRDSVFIYDGTPKSLAVSGLPAGASVTYGGNGKTPAGIYPVTATVKRENHQDSILTATLTIRKAAAVITAAQTQKHGYDASVKNVVATLNHTETPLTYSPQQGYSAAGTYPVIVSAAETANYKKTVDTVTLIIEKAGMTGLALRDSAFTYDGTPKSLAVTGLPEDAAVSYSGNTKTNAGTYTVTALVKRTNYQDSTLTATLTIRKAAAVITATQLQKHAYDGAVKNVAATLNHTETALAYSPQKGYSAAGTYPVIISAAETANYLTASDTVSLVIEKGFLVGIALRDSAFTYNGTPRSLVATGLPQGASVTYSGNGKTDAGRYTVTAVVKRPHYQDSTLTATLTIHKAPAVITAQAEQTHTADGSVKNVVASLNHNEVPLTYSPQKGYKLPGVYTITVAAAESKNYLGTSVQVRLAIDKATFQGVGFPGAEFTYDGTARFLYVSGVPEGASVTYSGNGQTHAGSYTVKALIQKENYHDLELSANLVIHKASATIWAESQQNHVYNGSVIYVQAWLNHSETALEYSPRAGYVDAGSYTVTVSAGETRNYLPASTAVHLFIDKARFQGVSLPSAEFIYNGSPHSLEVTGAPAGATITYAGNGRTNAGTYTVTALVQMKNYYDLELEASLVIHKAPQTIAFEKIGTKHLENDSDFQLEATSSSGLPVRFTYTYQAEEPPATVTPEGWVEMHTSGYVQITAHQEGNENYLPAESVTRQLKINSSDATLHRLTLGDEIFETPEAEVYYLMDCADERDRISVQLKTEVGAYVVPGRSLTLEIPRPGIYRQEIKITSQDSTNVLHYAITVEKRFQFEEIGVQKFNNLFLVNNNPLTNGGYEFVEYEWYKNGKLVSNGQYYSAGSQTGDILDGTAQYHVRMKTADGQWLSTCSFAFLPDETFTLGISPNPVLTGDVLTVKTGTAGEAKIRVLTITGATVLETFTREKQTQIRLPAHLAAGTYILQYDKGKQRKSLQFVLEK